MLQSPFYAVFRPKISIFLPKAPARPVPAQLPAMIAWLMVNSTWKRSSQADVYATARRAAHYTVRGTCNGSFLLCWQLGTGHEQQNQRLRYWPDGVGYDLENKTPDILRGLL